MKPNALVRIIFFSLIILILVSVLLTGLGVSLFTYRVDSDTESFTLGSGKMHATEVRDIEIEWAAGSITIEAADTDTISFRETGDRDSEPMVYKHRGDKLTIEYQARNVIFGINSFSGKDLVITVPRNWQCGKLTINAASADLTVYGLRADDVALNMASGNSEFTDCDIYELELDCASGKLNYTGTLYNLDCDTASGDITAILDNVPKSIDFDGASADLDLTLPADSGFVVEMDALSGHFNSEFETIQRNGQYICGDGACKIDVDGMSGKVSIHKGTAVRP